MSNSPQRGDSCLKRGCLLLLFLIFLFIGLFAWGAYSLYKHVYALTSEAPIELPAYTGTAYPGVKQQIEAFQATLQKGQAATLRLTADDLNAIVANDPAYQDLRGRMHFSIQNDRLTAQASLPLSGVRGMENRWFNGSITFALNIESGTLVFIPKAIHAGDREAPAEVIKALQAFPWTDMIVKDPKLSEGFSKIRSLRIENDVLIVECMP